MTTVSGLSLRANRSPMLTPWQQNPLRTLPARYWIVLTAFTFSSILPGIVSLPLQIIVLIGAYCEWLLCPNSERRGAWVVLICSAIIGYWFIQMWHPNVPNFQVGMIGFRKSALAISGIVLGCAIPYRYLRAFSLALVLILGSAVAISVISHYWIPDITKLSQSTSADVYTSMFRGQRRLQGVFVGPFHAALAGGALICWSMCHWASHKAISQIILTIGIVGLYLTLVRTAYVGLLGVFLTFLVLSPSVNSFAKRLSMLSLALLAGVALARILNWDAFGIVTTILDLGSDQRFLNRFDGYEYALDAIGRSPLFGWGAGAAGDVLGPAFSGRVHVTSHNLLIKILMEGGIVGATLWFALIASLAICINVRADAGRTAVCCLVLIGIMGLTGSAIEALPVTYLMFTLVGLGVSGRRIQSRTLGTGSARRNALKQPLSAGSSVRVAS